MEKKHKIQTLSAKRNHKKNNGDTQLLLKAKRHEQFTSGELTNLLQIELAECSVSAKREAEEYITLFESLVRTKYEEKYIKSMDTSEVPYEIPRIYSLQSDKEELGLMKKRLNILKKKMYARDIEAIASDWKKVGGDINESINTTGRIYAGKHD